MSTKIQMRMKIPIAEQSSVSRPEALPHLTAHLKSWGLLPRPLLSLSLGSGRYEQDPVADVLQDKSKLYLLQNSSS